jgi:Copper type II ascorbate-dependent monooxygenase, C-terminal domain
MRGTQVQRSSSVPHDDAQHHDQDARQRMRPINLAYGMGAALALSALSGACTDSSDGPSDAGGGGPSSPGNPFDASTPFGGDAGRPVTPSGDAAVSPSGPPAASRGLPCDVQAIVDAKCAACHSDPPVGTYMPLLTQAHFQAQGFTDKTKKYYELSKARVTSADKPMPPRTSPQLTSDELAKLGAWLDQGAPASTASCGSTVPDGGTTPPPDTTDTTGLECYRFVAHARGDKTKKFKVGQATDAYYSFGFKAQWSGLLYGQLVRPVIDNAKVLHHWLLYKENVQDGSIETTIGQHTGGELVHGWAPGGTPMDMRKNGDVGFELPDSTYALELHYNSSDANAEDASGVEVCGKKTAPANIASMTWLGYDQGGTASYATGGFCLDAAKVWTGTCVPQSREPIHIVYMVPHLHQTGLHLKSVINMPGGAKRTLHDAPFDFATQVGYASSEVLQPGETITTTCTFSENKCAGQGTEQEMCYLFTYAYPKYALTDNGPAGTFMHGKGACLGQ